MNEVHSAFVEHIKGAGAFLFFFRIGAILKDDDSKSNGKELKYYLLF
jgi:hypothetical protein